MALPVFHYGNFVSVGIPVASATSAGSPGGHRIVAVRIFDTGIRYRGHKSATDTPGIVGTTHFLQSATADDMRCQFLCLFRSFGTSLLDTRHVCINADLHGYGSRF